MTVGERKTAGSDKLLVVEILAGSTVKDAAETAKMSEATARRHLGDPAVRVRLVEARERIWATAAHLLSEAAVDAVETLRRLATSAETETVQLQAARSIIQGAPPILTLVDVQRRLGALELDASVNGSGL